MFLKIHCIDFKMKLKYPNEFATRNNFNLTYFTLFGLMRFKQFEKKFSTQVNRFETNLIHITLNFTTNKTNVIIFGSLAFLCIQFIEFEQFFVINFGVDKSARFF